MDSYVGAVDDEGVVVVGLLAIIDFSIFEASAIICFRSSGFSSVVPVLDRAVGAEVGEGSAAG